MATATTVYEVQTRFVTESTQAERAMERLERKSGKAHSQLVALGRRLAFTLKIGASLAGGYTIHRVFANLNEELSRSLSMAAQFNNAFRFNADPILNFNAALGQSRAVVRDLIADAARLPGETRDFIAAAQMISGGVFGGSANVGQGRATLRRMVGNLQFAAGGANQNPTEAANQLQAFMFGGAGRDRPLWAFLSGIFPELLGTAETFNVLPQAEKVRRLDEALERFAGNPAFREAFLRTWDVQFGTLKDSLFGPQGIFSRGGGREVWQVFIGGLSRLNTFLDENGENLAKRLYYIIDALAVAYGNLPNMSGNVSPGPGFFGRVSLGASALFAGVRGVYENMVSGSIDAYRQLGMSLAADAGMFGPEITGLDVIMAGKGAPHSGFGFMDGVRKYFQDPIDKRAHDRFMLDYWSAMYGKDPADGAAGDALPTHGTQVVQNFDIKLDLKSDTSPETIAIRLKRAMEQGMERAPISASRAMTSPGIGTGRAR